MSKFLNNNLIDGRAIANSINERTVERLKQLSFQPLLCDVVVGNDPASLSYVRIKQATAEKFGIAFRAEHMPEESTTEQVVAKINEIQSEQNLCGLIVQLPLPNHLDKSKILEAINPSVDVDVIGPKSIDIFYSGEQSLIPPTAGAVMEVLSILESDAKVNLNEQKIVVAGQGELVGKPITYLLKQKNYNVETISLQTENSAELMFNADVVISGMGHPGFITSEKVKDNVIIIDAGTSESEGSIKGDTDFESVLPKAKYITTTPGGVGPITVSKLLENVVLVAQNKN